MTIKKRIKESTQVQPETEFNDNNISQSAKKKSVRDELENFRNVLGANFIEETIYFKKNDIK